MLTLFGSHCRFLRNSKIQLINFNIRLYKIFEERIIIFAILESFCTKESFWRALRQICPMSMMRPPLLFFFRVLHLCPSWGEMEFNKISCSSCFTPLCLLFLFLFLPNLERPSNLQKATSQHSRNCCGLARLVVIIILKWTSLFNEGKKFI